MVTSLRIAVKKLEEIIKTDHKNPILAECGLCLISCIIVLVLILIEF